MANTHSIDFENSSSQYLTASSLVAYAPSSYTFEAWVKIEAGGIEGGEIITKDDATNRQFDFSVGVTGGFDLEHYRNGGEQHIVRSNVSNPITTGVWIHVAVTNNAGTFLFYRNGIVQVTTIAVNNYVAQGDKGHALEIGRRDIGGSPAYMDGLIDEVRFWNTVRSGAQILANYQTELVGNESGLIGYWKMNEGTETNVNDETSNNNDMTLINTPVWSSDIPFRNATFFMNLV